MQAKRDVESRPNATSEAALVGARVRLRSWCDRDLEPFAALNADPEVMRYFPATLARAESDALAQRIRAFEQAHGYGFWALEILESRSFAGFVGLSRPNFAAPFLPAVEIGWRLGRPFWGQGFAREGARLALAWGFAVLKLPEIIAFTAVSNVPSRRVMQAIGMRYCPEETFAHPAVAPESALSLHVLYRARADRPVTHS